MQKNREAAAKPKPGEEITDAKAAVYDRWTGEKLGENQTQGRSPGQARGRRRSR
jgi:hypothetical protein